MTGGEASVPVPTLMEGPQAQTGNFDVADQLFLRLAELGPTLITAGDGRSARSSPGAGRGGTP